MLVEVEDDELGPIRMHNVFPRMSATPGQVRHTGRPLGADNESVYVEELGHSSEELEQWRQSGVI
jgi:crotonobetainyl-CoA:carnitine CoA-transferase CaiB-like acyl-CoA transferase